MADSWMYILRCKNGAFYVGKANNLHYRIAEHSGAIPSARLSKYVQWKEFERLVYFELFPSEQEALARESELKHWHPERYVRRRTTPVRAYKDYLVSHFPQWKLQAFNATTSDGALKHTIMDGTSRGLPNFIPVSPHAWWSAETERVATAERESQERDAEYRATERMRRQREDRNFNITWLLITIAMLATVLLIAFAAKHT